VIEYRQSDITHPPYKLHVHTESPFLGKRLEIRNTLTITPESDTTTLQRLHGTVKVRMLGMGRIIEHIIRDSVAKTYKQLPAIIARWEAFRTEAVERGDPCALLRGRPPVGGDLDYVRKIMCSPYTGQSSMSISRQHAEKPVVRSREVLVNDDEDDGEVYYDAQEMLLDDTDQNLEQILAQDEHAVFSNFQYERDSGDGDREENGKENGVALEPQKRFTTRPRVEVIILEDYDPKESESPSRRLMHPAVARHRRGLSIESVESNSEGSEILSHRENRTPGSRGAKKAWKRFNRDYEAWDTYWGKEIGVKAISAAHQGAVRVVHVLDAAIRAGALKIIPGSKNSKHRRSKSAPGDWPEPVSDLTNNAKLNDGSRSPSPLKPSPPRKGTAPSRFAVEEETLRQGAHTPSKTSKPLNSTSTIGSNATLPNSKPRVLLCFSVPACWCVSDSPEVVTATK
jgi:hypothetical protein